MSTQLKAANPNLADCLAILEMYRKKINELEAEINQKERTDKLMSRIGVRYQNKDFSDFTATVGQQKAVKQIIESYVDTFQERLAEGKNLIFMGTPRTGKTFLSLIMYQTLIKSGWMAEYNANNNFLKRLREKQFDSYSEFVNILTFYKNLPFLILDEVTEGCGVGAAPSDWERSILRLIIDTRYSAKRCTLIITNRNKEELIERLGTPIVSRLTENGITLAFNWDSFRKI